MPETVVFVHGLWMVGVDMSLLRRRVRRCGFTTYQFSYASVRSSPSQNAQALQDFLATVKGDTVHFVAHSLGGLVVRYLFHLFPQPRPGRIVTIGTPHQGSDVAHRLAGSFLGRGILGKSLEAGLLGDLPPWTAQREIGIIAGDISLGMGRLVEDLSTPNDGTVSIKETNLSGMTDSLIVHTSHMGLLISKEVARQVCVFLKTGHFVHTE